MNGKTTFAAKKKKRLMSAYGTRNINDTMSSIGLNPTLNYAVE